jgi:hypothetical protein
MTSRPIPPVRAEFQPNAPEEALLPRVPERMDRPGQDNSAAPHQVNKEISDEQQSGY